jgi:hypothetical protein
MVAPDSRLVGVSRHRPAEATPSEHALQSVTGELESTNVLRRLEWLDLRLSARARPAKNRDFTTPAVQRLRFGVDQEAGGARFAGIS